MATTSHRRRGSLVNVTWFGHSAFLFETSGGKRILVDPWLENPNAPAGAATISNIDAILITHGHSDHVGNALEVARRTNATLVAIHEVSLYLKSKGAAHVTGMNKGGSVEIGGVTVTMTDAKHSSAIDSEEPITAGGEAAGYVIRFENGRVIYHAGDTAVFGDMKLIGQMYAPDIACIPIGGLYTMGPREAAAACSLLKPRAAILGMHYGTYPPLAGTPDQLRKFLPAPLRKLVRELKPGISMEL